MVISARRSIRPSTPAEFRSMLGLTEAIFSGESVSGTPAV
jgi:hypothetical protein